jgi:hypothetical protein
MQTHHAGFLLLLCVCVMLIFTDIHLLSVPHAGPLTRTHNFVNFCLSPLRFKPQLGRKSGRFTNPFVWTGPGVLACSGARKNKE